MPSPTLQTDNSPLQLRSKIRLLKTVNPQVGNTTANITRANSGTSKLLKTPKSAIIVKSKFFFWNEQKVEHFSISIRNIGGKNLLDQN